jgi:hypothetical protein
MRRLWVIALMGIASPTFAETPYVYQQGGLEGEQRTAIESQTTLGTRELRPLGGRGVEQGVRVRHQLVEGTTVEAFGGAVWQPEATDLRAGTMGAEVIQRVLQQSKAGVSLQIALGGYRDVTGVFVPRMRALLGRTWGRLHAQISSNLEVPIAAKRDGVDVILGAAASWQATADTSVGLEALGEDLEAIWDSHESEGGARLLAGPSLHTQWGAVYLHGNLGATTLWPGASAVGSLSPAWGAIGRVNLGWRF